MSENQNSGFGKFIPGFDFLQNLAKGASETLPQMPNLSNWVAPTLNLEELERRIGELKAVHFWLEQNSKALGATIQALEVQKMTLATLRGMNFNMGEVANALKLKPADTLFGGAKAQEASPVAAPETAAAAARPKAARKSAKSAGQPAGGVVDPLQWWGALTQQFQQIASGAMKDAAAQSAADGAGSPAGSTTGAAATAATGRAGKSAPRAKRPARKAQNR